MPSSPVIVYGSYGYTGQLIVEECKVKGVDVILSGRNAHELQKQSSLTGFPFEPVDISDSTSLCRLLDRSSMVIHAAGPFQFTALAMAEACLKTKTHYTDITGEIPVFETMASLDARAKTAGITLMPGVGFDVVPSDCLAMHLKNRLPSATHLQLAFASSKGGLSRGTSKTMVEGLGLGGAIRKNGKIIPVALHEGITKINYGPFQLPSIRIPWGDVSTAFYSTGIGNIEVFRGADQNLIKQVKISRYLNWLLRMRLVKDYLIKQIDKKPSGPDEERRNASKMFLWGKVWDDKQEKISLLETIEGYSLTAKTSVLIAQKIISGNLKTGFQTPSMAYGADLILEISGSRRNDL
ncbi:MAG: saccharopine dehydrogenase NADP-binding domain-containing protein [Bacteroidetes bacterium]|nr:saccharopine dehydrogenase NADP-binding domain-containing protein [Bacteroidota bacterium]MBI3483203.1 saccharopine dehydrogenase NADP-binding domain-containing protein [Bacteroidota bacterium]